MSDSAQHRDSKLTNSLLDVVRQEHSKTASWSGGPWPKAIAGVVLEQLLGRMTNIDAAEAVPVMISNWTRPDLTRARSTQVRSARSSEA